MNDILRIIPDPDALPVSILPLLILLNLTYFLHLISTGVMFGISAQIGIMFFKGKKDTQWKTMTGTMTKILPFTIAFAVNLGVAPLLFLQVLYANFFYTAAIVVAIPWILLMPVLIISYYSVYWLVFKKNPVRKIRAILILLPTFLFAAIAFLLVNINTLMLVPERWQMYFKSMNGFNLNLSEVTLWPRYLLYIFLFLAIGGSFTALFYTFNKTKAESQQGFHFGSIISAGFSLISIPALILFLLMLPKEIQTNLFKGDVLWLILIVLCISGLLIAGLLGYFRRIRSAAIMQVISLLIFVLIRNQIRIFYLKPFQQKLAVISQNPQYGVMILFAIVFILGLTLMIWILTKTAREYRAHQQKS